MKTRIAIIAGITSIAVLSFAFSSLDNNTANSSANSNPKVTQDEPVGGFVVEEIKR